MRLLQSLGVWHWLILPQIFCHRFFRRLPDKGNLSSAIHYTRIKNFYFVCYCFYPNDIIIMSIYYSFYPSDTFIFLFKIEYLTMKPPLIGLENHHLPLTQMTHIRSMKCIHNPCWENIFRCVSPTPPTSPQNCHCSFFPW